LGSNSSVAADPAPQRLAHLAAAAKSAGVKALFPEQGHSERLISALSRESGIPLAPVLTVGNLGSPDAPDGTYIGLMINNTSIIVQALGGKVAKMVSQE
jgi:ABC-type Zn uptake system ZnuABC Zn-binding protein ZnuA